MNLLNIKISQRDDSVQEHVENIGAPKVTIEPAYQGIIQRAVDFVNQKYPDLLRDVTDVFGHVDDSGVFGEFKTNAPHSIYINIREIEGKVRQALQGQPEDAIKREIENQIIKTIVHESTHRKEFSGTGHSTEMGPEQAEKAVEPLLEQISSRDQDPIIVSSMTKLAYIRKKGDKWCVMSHKGKSLGCYASRKQAAKRLRQIEYFKHKGCIDFIKKIYGSAE